MIINIRSLQNEIVFSEEKPIWSVEVLNTKMLVDIVKMFLCVPLQNGNDDNMIIKKDNFLSLDISKTAYVITDFFNVEALEKQLNTKLHKYLCNRILEDVEINSSLASVEKQLISIVEKACYDFDMDVEFLQEVAVSNIIKLIDPHIAGFDKTNIHYSLLSILDCFAFFLKDFVIVLVNAKDFFTVSEIEEILKHAQAKKLKILFIDAKQHLKLNGEVKLFIDEDMVDTIV